MWLVIGEGTEAWQGIALELEAFVRFSPSFINCCARDHYELLRSDTSTKEIRLLGEWHTWP